MLAEILAEIPSGWRIVRLCDYPQECGWHAWAVDLRRLRDGKEVQSYEFDPDKALAKACEIARTMDEIAEKVRG